MTIGAGGFELYVKPNGGSYASFGCIEKGFRMTDGWDYYEIKCDGSIGQTDYDYTFQRRLPIDLQFVLNNVINTEFDKVYAQWAAHYSELGTIDGIGQLASGRAFSAYLAPVSGSLWAARSNPYWVFPALAWTPGFVVNWDLGSKPTSLPISWRALRQNRTYNSATYNSFFYFSSSAPT